MSLVYPVYPWTPGCGMMVVTIGLFGKKSLVPASYYMEHTDTEAAFREAFERHADELFRHCSLRLSDRERALELTQETFLRAWEYVARGGHIEQHRSFLYRVLNNLIVDEYRKHKTQSLDALLENEEAAVYVEGELLRDDGNGLEDAMVRFDAKRAIEALRTLPEQYRAVLVMRYIDGLSPKEIAACTQESENAISVRIHRGLRTLRDTLATTQQI